MPRAERFDAVVVGSGMGGLAAASLLARMAGKRVLVLERHFQPGGFTQAFRRRRWSFDVGLHYVGGMAEGHPGRRLFDLASGGAVRWHKMPSPLERFVYPGFAIDVPDDPADYQEALAAAFPAERDAVARWFEAMRRAEGWANRHFLGLALPRPAAAALEGPGREAALRTTGAVLVETFRDPLLRAVVTSQWGDYGLPPSRSAFAVHAMVARHYFGGGYYPEGGSGAIAPAFLAAVEARGGECRVNHEVTEILVEGGRAAGVRAVARSGGEERPIEVRAPLVVSDAGAAATFGRLLRGAVPVPASDAGGTSAVALYLGLSRNPAEMGFRGGNWWIFDEADHDAVFARRNEVLRGRAGMAYLSFPSLRDPLARTHTAEIVAPADAGPFAPWRGREWRRRGGDYEALKATIAGALLDLVERHRPGFRDLVAWQEVSTPLTVEHFTGHPGGRIYGAPATPERFRDRAFGVRTPVRGLFLAGADAISLGVMGAFMGGLLAAGAAMGRAGVPRIFAAAGREAPPAEERAAP